MAIYIFGDSHTWKLKSVPNVKTFHLGAITMHRVGRDGLSVFDLIDQSSYTVPLEKKLENISENDSIGFVFGEIDIRNNIGKQIAAGRNIQEIVETLVSSYFNTLADFKIKYPNNNILVFNCTPSGRKEFYNHADIYNSIGTDEERKEWTIILNNELEKQISNYNFTLIDQYTPFSGTSGYIDPNMTQMKDGVHISKRFSRQINFGIDPYIFGDIKTNCPICNNKTKILDCVDLNGIANEKSGTAVYYHFCENCHFCFSPDAILINLNSKLIFEKAEQNAKIIISRFNSVKHIIKHIDYSYGAGILSKILIENGFNSVACDPNNINIEELGKFDLITSFDTFERFSNVRKFMNNLNIIRKPDGVWYFSTNMSDGYIKNNERMNWDYVVPKNGIINIFSKESLLYIVNNYGLDLGNLSNERHVAWDTIPEWAKGTIL